MERNRAQIKVKKMQLTVQQRVFVVVNYQETKSLREVKARFRQRYRNRNAPTSKTVLENVRKYAENGTSLNLNKGNSGRPVTVRNQETINNVRNALQENGRNLSCRRNGLQTLKKTILYICFS